nr:dTDP-4-dehydrorhamnose 3,5-epimerase [Microvirga puerhi]
MPDVLIVRTKAFQDSRGFFTETYNQAAFAKAGITEAFVQDNVSLSTQVGTVRGLHFQLPPFAQAKLVRVVRGRILDIAVDLRRASPTFGQHVAVELSETNRQQIFVPAGFAHGFCTLEPNTEVQYKVSASYSPTHDRGLAWDDPALGIPWPVAPERAILSDKDTKHPRLAALAAELF